MPQRDDGGARLIRQQAGISVWQQGTTRYLKFIGTAVQTRIALDRPHRLIEPHFQRLLLALVFAERPRSLTLLGLGGGALVHFFLHYRPELVLSVVEMNPAVVDIARDWFSLPDSGYQLHIGDAIDHVRIGAAAGPRQDLILVDIYTGDIIPAAVFSEGFLQDCHRLCSPDGILVINYLQPEQQRAEADVLHLKRIFHGGVLLVPVPERLNLIIIAFKRKPPELRHTRLKARAEILRRELDLPLSDWLEDIFTLYPRDESMEETAIRL